MLGAGLELRVTKWYVFSGGFGKTTGLHEIDTRRLSIDQKTMPPKNDGI